MATPLKVKDVDGNIQEFTTSDENYIAYQIGLHLLDDSANGFGTLTKNDSADTLVGNLVNTFFNEPVGTSPSTSITTGSTTTFLSQSLGSAAETDSDILLALKWIDSSADGPAGFRQFNDTDLNTAVDRYLTTIFTNNYPGTFYLADSAPSADYSVHLSNVFTDTRTDGTSIPYNVYRRDTFTAPAAQHPIYVLDSAGGAGISIKPMTDRQIKFSFGQRAKTRIGTSKIGTYQLRSSTAGAPTDPGTWVAKGTATDTKQTTSQVEYTTDFAGTYEGTYQNQYTRNYTNSYTVDYQLRYTANYLKAYQGTTIIGYENLIQYERGGLSREYAQTGDYTRSNNLYIDNIYAGYYDGAVFEGLINYTGSFVATYTGPFLAYENTAASFDGYMTTVIYDQSQTTYMRFRPTIQYYTAGPYANLDEGPVGLPGPSSEGSGYFTAPDTLTNEAYQATGIVYEGDAVYGASYTKSYLGLSATIAEYQGTSYQGPDQLFYQSTFLSAPFSRETVYIRNYAVGYTVTQIDYSGPSSTYAANYLADTEYEATFGNAGAFFGSHDRNYDTYDNQPNEGSLEYIGPAGPGDGGPSYVRIVAYDGSSPQQYVRGYIQTYDVYDGPEFLGTPLQSIFTGPGSPLNYIREESYEASSGTEVFNAPGKFYIEGEYVGPAPYEKQYAGVYNTTYLGPTHPDAVQYVREGKTVFYERDVFYDGFERGYVNLSDTLYYMGPAVFQGSPQVVYLGSIYVTDYISNYVNPTAYSGPSYTSSVYGDAGGASSYIGGDAAPYLRMYGGMLVAGPDGFAPGGTDATTVLRYEGTNYANSRNYASKFGGYARAVPGYEGVRATLPNYTGTGNLATVFLGLDGLSYIGTRETQYEGGQREGYLLQYTDSRTSSTGNVAFIFKTYTTYDTQVYNLSYGLTDEGLGYEHGAYERIAYYLKNFLSAAAYSRDFATGPSTYVGNFQQDYVLTYVGAPVAYESGAYIGGSYAGGVRNYEVDGTGPIDGVRYGSDIPFNTNEFSLDVTAYNTGIFGSASSGGSVSALESGYLGHRSRSEFKYFDGDVDIIYFQDHSTSSDAVMYIPNSFATEIKYERTVDTVTNFGSLFATFSRPFYSETYAGYTKGYLGTANNPIYTGNYQSKHNDTRYYNVDVPGYDRLYIDSGLYETRVVGRYTGPISSFSADPSNQQFGNDTSNLSFGGYVGDFNVYTLSYQRSFTSAVYSGLRIYNIVYQNNYVGPAFYEDSQVFYINFVNYTPSVYQGNYTRSSPDAQYSRLVQYQRNYTRNFLSRVYSRIYTGTGQYARATSSGTYNRNIGYNRFFFGVGNITYNRNIGYVGSGGTAYYSRTSPYQGNYGVNPYSRIYIKKYVLIGGDGNLGNPGFGDSGIPQPYTGPAGDVTYTRDFQASAYVNDRSFQGYVVYTGEVNFGYQRQSSANYTRNDFTNFSVIDYIQGPYNQEYTLSYDANYTRDAFFVELETYIAVYLGPNYTRAFEDPIIVYGPDYAKAYTRDYENIYTTEYVEDYIGNYVGNFEGETIDATDETIETFTLYVRIA